MGGGGEGVVPLTYCRPLMSLNLTVPFRFGSSYLIVEPSTEALLVPSFLSTFSPEAILDVSFTGYGQNSITTGQTESATGECAWGWGFGKVKSR